MKEAIAVLADLGLPAAQQNERSALTLLSLLDLKPDSPWSDSANPFMGITPMMVFFKIHYGKKYAPNSRETVRRQTVHQFLQAGLIVINPDLPSRPINSGLTVYQIESTLLELLRGYGAPAWINYLKTYLSSIETLRVRYAMEREMTRIPVTVAPGRTISLSAGGQNVLIKKIIDDFCSRFTPGGVILYVGDTDEKFAFYDEEAFRRISLVVNLHGKMPDIVIEFTGKQWLVLVMHEN